MQENNFYITSNVFLFILSMCIHFVYKACISSDGAVLSSSKIGYGVFVFKNLQLSRLLIQKVMSSFQWSELYSWPTKCLNLPTSALVTFLLLTHIHINHGYCSHCLFWNKHTPATSMEVVLTCMKTTIILPQQVHWKLSQIINNWKIHYWYLPSLTIHQKTQQKWTQPYTCTFTDNAQMYCSILSMRMHSSILNKLCTCV